ncbi:hypothetical protein ABET51_20465 [Metabacillus fastidiosus]|uniref:hypothetical protein n=1 Tax=Metabacillus fastidiosus TaxID=1458 RepID=UPI003D284A19
MSCRWWLFIICNKCSIELDKQCILRNNMIDQLIRRRKVNIKEATEQAMNKNEFIVREEWKVVKIKPTNTNLRCEAICN